MEFKTISTNPRRLNRTGFTLVELLTAAGISSLLLIVCFSVTLYTVRSIASAANSVDLNARSRYAVDRMSKKLRQATEVKAFSTNSVSVNYNGKALTYAYNPSLKTLVEKDSGTLTTLLEDCDELTFSLYKRNPVTNSFNQFPVLTATNEAKVVQVTWHCGRTLAGLESGSAEMVSARIVMRAK